jgi:hypothetical protein
MTEEEFNNAVSKIFKIELSNETKIYFEYTFNENTFRLKRKRFRESRPLGFITATIARKCFPCLQRKISFPHQKKFPNYY